MLKFLDKFKKKSNNEVQQNNNEDLQQINSNEQNGVITPNKNDIPIHKRDLFEIASVKMTELENYVENNSQKVFKYSTIAVILFTCWFVLMLIVPDEWRNGVKNKFFKPDVNKEKTVEIQKDLNKVETRGKLKLEQISGKFTLEQTQKYVTTVNQFIDKYKGDQFLYQNILEFISEHCINPNNQNTQLLIKSLMIKMEEHQQFFDENNRIMMGLIDKCVQTEQKIELPLSIKLLRTEMLRIEHNIKNRYLEINSIIAKYGKENVDPKTGNLTLNYKSEVVLAEEKERAERYSREEMELMKIKKNIYLEMDLLHRKGKITPEKKAILVTIMRDYPNDFIFFYDFLAKDYGTAYSEQFKSEVNFLIEQDKKRKQQ